MNDRLKKLEIKKLLKEYNYLMTDDEFKKLTNSLLEHESALVKNNPKLKNENSVYT